ncbi:IS3 family transposase [Bacillus sp. FSL K6-3431]|uniref:IS3 family transposase n=1 Tax=Bacillus sp. FSL K6-3431 TaxID=2921500 RepID=UPI0040469416
MSVISTYYGIEYAYFLVCFRKRKPFFISYQSNEVDFAGCHNLEELKQRIDPCIFKYNSHRYQWNLNKMTQEQYEGTEKLTFLNS